jgi:hypothetical protein
MNETKKKASPIYPSFRAVSKSCNGQPTMPREKQNEVLVALARTE